MVHQYSTTGTRTQPSSERESIPISGIPEDLRFTLRSFAGDTYHFELDHRNGFF